MPAVQEGASVGVGEAGKGGLCGEVWVRVTEWFELEETLKGYLVPLSYGEWRHPQLCQVLRAPSSDLEYI